MTAVYVAEPPMRMLAPAQCQATRCARTVETGEHLFRVTHLERFAQDPDARNAVAFLCTPCVTLLDARCRALPLLAPLVHLPPYPEGQW